MSGGHTPGPWKVSSGCDQYVCNGGFWIASTMGVRGEEGAANARLIAAAPDGLAFALAHDAYMLAAGYASPDDRHLHPNSAANWRQCRAFIAKATGGAS